jgi:hypothetical protein
VCTRQEISLELVTNSTLAHLMGKGVQHEMDLQRCGAMGGSILRGAFAARQLIPFRDSMGSLRLPAAHCVYSAFGPYIARITSS